MKKRLTIGVILTGAIVTPCLLRAADNPWERGDAMAQQTRDQMLSAPTLTIDETSLTTPAPQDSQDAAAPNAAAPTAAVEAPVLTLAAGGFASRIHGFADFRLLTAYFTPRGLAVVDTGVQFQPLVGLVFDVYQGEGCINDISLIGGAWSDFTSSHRGGGGDADIWDECDFFGSVDVKFLQNFDFTSTIAAWTFPTVGGTPENNPHTEYNADFKLSYNDSAFMKDFALHPYADLFWNFAGQSSPVVSQATTGGKNDKTFYVELGIGPSYTLKAINDYPITFSFPTYFSVGDSSFWGQNPTTGSTAAISASFPPASKPQFPLRLFPTISAIGMLTLA